MRSAMLAAAAIAGLVAGLGGSTVPASARDYAYCLQGRIWGYPGKCDFSTYEQCQLSASGTDAACGINPRAALADQRRTPRYRYRDY